MSAPAAARALRPALLAALASLLVAAASDDLEPVRRGFSAYKQALLAKDGNAAAQAVSANSLAYYDRLRALALSGTKSEIEALDGTEQVLILNLRVRAPAPLLRAGSSQALIAYAVGQGMISAGSVARTDLGAVSIDGDRADASLVVDGEPVPGSDFHFRREGSVWKVDLEHAMSLTRGLFQALAKQQGTSQEALVLDLLSQTAGRPIGPEVWNPPVPK